VPPLELQGLRLLLVGNWPAPIGGVSIHVRALRDAARKAGAHVTVLDIGEGQNRAEGVIASGGPASFATKLLGLLQSNDLVHVHTSGANPKSWLLTGLVGMATRASACKPLVTFHSGHGPRYLDTTARVIAARAALTPYKRVICVNQEISRTLNRIGAAFGRHVIAPAFGREGVLAGQLPPTVAPFVGGGQPLISAMLAPGREYGATELFGAFQLLAVRHPAARLVVYGPGTADAFTTTLAKPLGSKVLFLGQIERGEALAIVQASQLFVRPTLVDGDAVSVREALALGTRVVATRVGHRPAGVVLSEAGSIVDLARAMDTALTTPAATSASSDPDGIETVLQVYGSLARQRMPLAA
jgi:glycogen(starch) synthase